MPTRASLNSMKQVSEIKVIGKMKNSLIFWISKFQPRVVYAAFRL